MSWSTPRSNHLRLMEMALFGTLGALMFCSKLVMEFLPNIHLLGALTMAFTLVFRVKALIPIYIYVALCGIYAGFSPWWVFHLYVWAVLWGITMLLPRRMPHWLASVVYPAVCCLHGLAFGVLCAPAQAILYDLDLPQTLTWIVLGFPYDLIHAHGNLLAGLLILPLVTLMRRLLRQMH